MITIHSWTPTSRFTWCIFCVQTMVWLTSDPKSHTLSAPGLFCASSPQFFSFYQGNFKTQKCMSSAMIYLLKPHYIPPAVPHRPSAAPSPVRCISLFTGVLDALQSPLLCPISPIASGPFWHPWHVNGPIRDTVLENLTLAHFHTLPPPSDL